MFPMETSKRGRDLKAVIAGSQPITEDYVQFFLYQAPKRIFFHFFHNARACPQRALRH